MLGSIAGDIIGSIYESKSNRIKTKDFPLFSEGSSFTDDTVLTVALAQTILSGESYVANLKRFYKKYSDRGYGGSFRRWAESMSSEPYNSYGNGAAMRISPVGYAYEEIEMVLKKAEEFTVVTHNHVEGIKGAQATAAAIFLARRKRSKEDIKEYVEIAFGYDLSKHVDELRPSYRFDVSSQGTVPQAIRCFLDSTDFEDAIRTAVSLGGDSDTLACITGGIAQAFYGGVPFEIQKEVYHFLDHDLADITRAFMKKFCTS